MVAVTPHVPVLFLKLYTDDVGPYPGSHPYTLKDRTFNTQAFVRRVLTFGSLDRSIPIEPGDVTISDMRVEVEDVDGSLKAIFDTNTPYRRLAQIFLEFESEDTGDSGYEYHPIYTGEIRDVTCPPGRIRLTLHDLMTTWLD